MTDDVGPPLTPEEGRMLIKLLARYCTHNVDQFDTWRLSLPAGNFFIAIEDSGTPGGLPVEFFREVWPPRPTPSSASSASGDSTTA
ncbi:hypothetical protein [Catenulispora subtropica]|uniref:Uncharacterized protein n=1 Tax=Catenulispora subtropica TaxID=450798 RepID=A0ABP5CQT2_9ACTN